MEPPLTLDLLTKRNHSYKCVGNGRADVFFGMYDDARAAPFPLHRSPRDDS
jgi:hypothetical protein